MTCSFRDVPYLWGVDEYPGLGQIVFACFAAFSEANAKAIRMLKAPKQTL